MGTCARCGATVIDEGAWKESYLAQLGYNNEMSKALRGYRKLFANHLYVNPARHYEYSFSLRAIMLCRLQEELPKSHKGIKYEEEKEELNRRPK